MMINAVVPGTEEASQVKDPYSWGQRFFDHLCTAFRFNNLEAVTRLQIAGREFRLADDAVTKSAEVLPGSKSEVAYEEKLGVALTNANLQLERALEAVLKDSKAAMIGIVKERYCRSGEASLKSVNQDHQTALPDPGFRLPREEIRTKAGDIKLDTTALYIATALAASKAIMETKGSETRFKNLEAMEYCITQALLSLHAPQPREKKPTGVLKASAANSSKVASPADPGSKAS